jgi:hypothetical protein
MSIGGSLSVPASWGLMGSSSSAVLCCGIGLCRKGSPRRRRHYDSSRCVRGLVKFSPSPTQQSMQAPPAWLNPRPRPPPPACLRA